MNLLRAALLVRDLLAPVNQMSNWPDGEQPLIDTYGNEPALTDDEIVGLRQLLEERFNHALGETADNLARVTSLTSVRGASVPLAGVDPAAERPTPGAGRDPGVGHLKLLLSAAVIAERYSRHVACVGAIYCQDIARQLRQAATDLENTEK